MSKIIEKVYVSATPPKVTNVLWLQPETHKIYAAMGQQWVEMSESGGDLSDYYTKAEVDEKFADKQDTLTAGQNISIEDNTVAAKGYVFNKNATSFSEGDLSVTWTSLEEISQEYGIEVGGQISGSAGVSTYTYGGDPQKVAGFEYLLNMIISQYGTYIDYGYIKTQTGKIGSYRLANIDVVNKTFTLLATLDAHNDVVNEEITHIGYTRSSGPIAIGDNSHSEGYGVSIGHSSHSEGNTVARGARSHSEGYSYNTESNLMFLDTYDYNNVTQYDYELESASSFGSTYTLLNGTTDNMYIGQIFVVFSSISTSSSKRTPELHSVDKIKSSTQIAFDSSLGTRIKLVAYSRPSGLAYGYVSHSEGRSTCAYGDYSHAEGDSTTAVGYRSHAEGCESFAGGSSSHTEGIRTLTHNDGEHAEGWSNYSHRSNSDRWCDAGNTVHSIGIGESHVSEVGSNGKNAVEVMTNGDMYVLGVGGYQGTDTKVQDATIKTLQEYIASLEARIAALENGNS